MQKSKKIFSLLLAFVMALCSTLPVWAYSDAFDVSIDINSEKGLYSSNEEILLSVVSKNNSSSVETVAVDFKSTSLIQLGTKSDVLGTALPNEEISKNYVAVATDVKTDTDWFTKISMIISSSFSSFICRLSAFFQNNTDCVVVTVNGYSAAVMVSIYETETPVHKVDFDLQYNATEIVPSQEVSAKSVINIPENPEREGYTFEGWYKDEDLTEPFDFKTLIVSDTILYAKWSKNTVFYSVTFEYDDGSEVVVSVKEATMVEEPSDPDKVGYLFDGWYDSETSELFDFSTPIVKDVVLKARWIEDVFGDSEYMVTFVWNDGVTDGVYDTQLISPNKKVSKPIDPEKEKYSFLGWYLDPTTVEKFDFSTRITSDTILYAKWGSPNGEDGIYSSTEGGETDYAITDFEIEGNDAIAQINTNEMCVVVVRFFDENINEEFHIIAAQSPEYCEMTKINIPIDYDLPDYFKVSVGLYNFDGELLCNEYISIEFTSAYEEFESLTVHDFEGKTVLNFDESLDNNFGVLSDGVVQIEQDDGVNILTTYSSMMFDDSETDLFTYSFSNYDEQISSLETGDVILAMDSDGAYQLIKVGYIETVDDELVIYPSSDSELSDFYEVIKVDTFQDSNESNPRVYTRAARGIDIIDVDTTLPSATFSPLNLTYKPVDWLTINGTAKGTAKVDIEMVYNFRLFGPDYCKVSVETVTELEVSVTVMAGGDNSDEVENQMKEKWSYKKDFAKIPIPTPVTGLSVVVKAGITSEISLEGGLKFTFTNKTTSGFVYDTNSGRQKVDKKERTLSILDVQGKAEYKIGPKVSVGIAFLGTIVEASVEAQAGAKITATADIINLPDNTTAEERHACTTCIKIEARWFVEVSVKLEYEINEVLKGEVFNLTIIDLEGQILFGSLHSCYMSLIHSADSVFGTSVPQFGFGECPNKTYRTTIKLVDSNDNEITGTNVSVKKINGKLNKSGSSTFVVYLYNGQYTVSTKIGGTAINKTIVVSGDAQEIKLKPTSTDGGISGKVSSSVDNAAINNANILVTKDNLVVKSLKSGSDGKFNVSLPNGVYCVQITKDNYITFTQYVTVEESNTTYLNTALLVAGDKTKRGGFSGVITNAVTGDPVKGAELIIRKGWNNPSYGDVVAKLETDSNGKFKYNSSSFLGITSGLESGNYTATVSKAGFATTSFDIIVLPGEVKGNQNASISPNAQGNYRVVLTWGSTPSDLDSHFTAYTNSGSYAHVYYRDKQLSVANLDIDDTSSYGPETITITNFDSLDDGFTYAVHNFSDRSATSNRTLSNSGATVKLYKGNTLLKTYYVPVDKVGTVWRVFSVDENGVITDHNYLYNQSDPALVK